MLVADADLPEPVMKALRAVRYPIARYSDLGLPVRPDGALMQKMLESTEHRVLVTLDAGIPSQAYYYQFAKSGLTVVVLRWKKQNAKAWQEMTLAILRDGESWEKTAAEAPSVISVSHGRGSRTRPWESLPGGIGGSVGAGQSGPHDR